MIVRKRSWLFLIALAVLLILVAYPLASSAQVDVNAQIQSILARVVELSAILSGLQANEASSTPTTIQTNCPVIARTLSLGARGTDVIALQDFLISAKVLAAGNNTGYFGSLTEAAVKQWQSQKGIIYSGDASTGYGVVGPRTRAAINASCGSVAAPTPVTPTAQPVVRPSISILSPKLGNPAVSAGDNLLIEWQSTNTPSQALVSLSLLNSAGSKVGGILEKVQASGEYNWKIPGEQGECDPGEDPFSCILKLAGCSGSSLCSVPSGSYRIMAALSGGISTTSAVFQVANGYLPGILKTTTTDSSFLEDSLQNLGRSSGASSAAMSCNHEGASYTPDTMLSVPCSGNCPSSGGGTGFVTATCKGGQWCIPFTNYCNAAILGITTTAYQSLDAAPIGSGYGILCPQEGYKAYLACDTGSCQRGWHTCKQGSWLRDAEQQSVQAGVQGPCFSGQLWCAIGDQGGFGCVAAAQCIAGKATI